MLRLLSLLFLFTTFAHANGSLKVYIHCRLDNDYPANCDVLKNNIDDEDMFERVTLPDDSDIVISISKVSTSPTTTELKILVSKENNMGVDGIFGEFPIALRDKNFQTLIGIEEAMKLVEEEELSPEGKITYDFEITNSMVKSAAQNYTLSVIKQTLLPYFELKSIDTTEEGEIHIVMDQPEESLNTVKNEKSDKENPFYALPSVGGNFRQGNGVQRYSVGADVNAIYATPKYKAMGRLFYNDSFISSQNTNYVNGSLAQTTRSGARLTVLKTVGKKSRWQIAVVTRARQARSQFEFSDNDVQLAPEEKDNTSSYFEGKVGVEWLLVPFQESDEGNLAIRYRIGTKLHNYIDPQSLEEIHMALFQHGIELSYSQTFSKLDLSGYIAADSNVLDTNFAKLGMGVKAVYRITPRIGVQGNVGVNYFTDIVPSPAYLEYVSFQTLTSGNKDPFSIGGNVRLYFVIGNSKKDGTDNRWR